MARLAGADSGAPRVRSALRPLGPRGEGWVGIQTAIAIIVLVSAVADPLSWSEADSTIPRIVGVALCLAGVGLFGWGAVTLGSSFSIWVAPRPGAQLVVSGPYRWTRHPICTAQAIFGFGWALAWSSPIALIQAVVYAAYLDRFKLRREEETLLVQYPTAYPAYVARVRHRMWPVPPGRDAAMPTDRVGRPG